MLLVLRTFIVFLWACLMILPISGSVDLSDKGKASGKLRWNKDKIRIAISDSLFKENQNIKQGSNVREALFRSIAVWEAAVDVKFEVYQSDVTNVSPSGPNGDGVNLITTAPTAENILFFGKHALDTPAATRIFFDAAGNITESDIVLNPLHQFSTDGTFGTFDLEMVLVHELGHLLGLDHSGVSGAVMNDLIPKNGLFNISHSYARELTEVDLVNARDLYGASLEEKDCCGSIELTLSIPKRKAGPGGTVWAELKSTGQVFALTESVNSRTFKFRGLPEGNYSLYWKGQINSRAANSIHYIQDVEVAGKKSTLIKKSFTPREIDHELTFIGLNAELSKSAVSLSPGKVFDVYFGGLNLAADKVVLGTDSPFLFVDNSSVLSLDYGDEITVLSAKVEVSPEAPNGVYSVYAEDASGKKSYLIGSIVISNN